VQMTPSSVFQVGSISKPVAAWVVMTLVRDGKLSLDMPICRYLTRWKLPRSEFASENVTLRQLLSHTAGLTVPAYTGFPESESLPSLEASLLGNTRDSRAVELFQAPGEGFRYSGGGYTLIQLLVEEVSGQPFKDYAEDAVLTPLGMNNSSYEPDEKLLKHRVQPHGYSRDEIIHHHFRAQAAASLHTTALDLTRFLIANVSDNSILDKRTVSMMHSAVVDAGFADMGLGFFSRAEQQLVGHSGANLGWRADMQFNPSSKNGLIVMTNSDGAGPFLSELKCHWDAQQKTPVINRDCLESQARADMYATTANRIVWALATVFLLVIFTLAWSLQQGTLGLVIPRTMPRILGVLSLLSAMLFIIVFLYTPFGVYLTSGFRSLFAAIHYAPAWVATLAPWILMLLGIVGIAFFLKRTPE